jgi:nicotinic acid mononucleotide adenylyltransferase
MTTIKNNENTILFTIGRMNPPTSGHMLLIRTMMEEALQKGLTQINLILSATTDNKKNPLSCEEKRYFILHFMIHHLKELMKIEQPQMSQQIDAIQVKIVCMDDVVNPDYGKHPILKSIQYLLQDLYGYPRENLQMVLFIGEDRIKDYDWIQKSLLERNPPVTMEIHGLDRPEGAMSATYIRNLALQGNLDSFRLEMSKTGLDETSTLNLYNEIREKLKPSILKKKKGGSTRKKRKRKGKTMKRKKP